MICLKKKRKPKLKLRNTRSRLRHTKSKRSRSYYEDENTRRDRGGFPVRLCPDGGMGRERNIVIDFRLTDFTPVTKIQGEVNRDGWRRMTPREWARLQGFPDNFKITVSDAQAYKQFGNSVAIPVIQATAQIIIKRLGDTKNV